MLVLSLACALAAHGYYLMQLPPIHSLSAVSNVATCWSVPLSMHLPPVLWAWLRAPSPWLYWTQSPPGGENRNYTYICLFLFMDIALGCVVRYWNQPPPGGKNRLTFLARGSLLHCHFLLIESEEVWRGNRSMNNASSSLYSSGMLNS